MAQPAQQTPYQQGGSGPSGPRAGFGRRAGAAIVDGILLGVVASVLTAVLGQGGSAVEFSATYQSIVALLTIAYDTYFEGGPSGQTIGKRALGIRVIDYGTGGPIGYGRGLGRGLAKILSGIPLGLGYFWMLWDPQKQTWHDKIVRSVVVPVADYPVQK